jgi:hypothetical protein
MKFGSFRTLRGGSECKWVLSLVVLIAVPLLLSSTALGDGGSGNPKDSVHAGFVSNPDYTSSPIGPVNSLSTERAYTAYRGTSVVPFNKSWGILWRMYSLLYWIRL